MPKKRNTNKFEFGSDFQELILKYTLTDPKGFRILPYYDDDYFDLISHQAIAMAIKKFFKKHKTVPDLTYLREQLRTMYKTEHKVFEHLLPDDRKEIDDLCQRLFDGTVKKPELVVDQVIQFARFINFKEELEKVDVFNFDSWSSSIKNFQKAQSIGKDIEKNFGTFLVRGMPDRAHKRDLYHSSCPTPFWQFNNLLNPGGTERGNVIAVMSKEKMGKTVALINIARGYMKMRKIGFYADLENGEMGITIRSEQSIYGKAQGDIKSGKFDDNLLKLFRKYKRIGAELIIKSFPNIKTTTNDLQVWVDELQEEYQIKFDFGIVDYGLLMGAISGKDDDFNRISDAFLDLKNFAKYNDLEALYTAAHVTRDGAKRVETVFKSTDIAKCHDISRHIDVLLGLQQNEAEAEANVWRFEVVAQRNGMKEGKMLFWVDIEKQRMKEFTKTEVKKYMAQIQGDDEDEEENPKEKKRKRSGDL